MSDNKQGRGIDRRGALECMIWAGTGVIWTLGGGVPKSVMAGTAIVFRNCDDIPHIVVGTKGEFHSNALDTDDRVFRSPSPRPEPTPILAACIHECRAGSWSRRDAGGVEDARDR